MKKIFVLALISFISIINIYAQSHNSSQGHEEQVNCIGTVSGLNYDQSFFTAGQDGFIIKWSSDNQGEHYQITDVGIKFISIPKNDDCLCDCLRAWFQCVQFFLLRVIEFYLFANFKESEKVI